MSSLAMAASRGRRLTAVPIEPDPAGDPQLVPLGIAADRLVRSGARHAEGMVAELEPAPTRLAPLPVRPRRASHATPARDGADQRIADRIAGRVADAYGLSNVLAAPLRVDGQTEGAIVVSRRTSEAWPASAHRILEAAASEASAALVRVYSLREAEARASTDALTGLPNRRYFDEYLGLLAKRRRAEDRVGVLMVDIDRFKKLNDTFGHAVGDHVLREVARAIAEAVREDDVPARFGGEEFAVLLRNPSPQVAVDVGERVRRAVAALDLRRLGVPGVSVSVGVAVAESPDVTARRRRRRSGPGPVPGEARGSRPGRRRVARRNPYPWVMPRRVVQTDLPARVDEAVPDHVDEPAADADEATRRRRRAATGDQRRPRADLPRDRRHPRGQGRDQVQDRRLPPRGRRHRPGAVRRRGRLRRGRPASDPRRGPGDRRQDRRARHDRPDGGLRAAPCGDPGQPRRPAADPGRRAADRAHRLRGPRRGVARGPATGRRGRDAPRAEGDLGQHRAADPRGDRAARVASPAPAAQPGPGDLGRPRAAARGHAGRRADRAGGVAPPAQARPIGDLDLLVETDDPDGVVARFTGLGVGRPGHRRRPSEGQRQAAARAATST